MLSVGSNRPTHEDDGNSAGAHDAGTHAGECQESLDADRSTTTGAGADLARVESIECSPEITQIIPRLPQQCPHLRSLVGDGRALGVVLVVGRCEFGGVDDRIEAALERSDLLAGSVLLHLDGRSQRLLLIGFQGAHRVMVAPIGSHVHATDW